MRLRSLSTKPRLLLLAVMLAAAASQAETRRALLAGCNYYTGGLSRLYTSINDITGVRDAILCPADGFWLSSNVVMLKDGQATYDRVRQQLASAAQVCQDGDVFVFMYSGHGTSYQGSEYICLYDYDYQDSQLGTDLAQFGSGVKIVIILDTCYSGGMFKAAGARGEGGAAASAFAERVLAAYQEAKAADPAVGSLVSKAALGANIGFMTASDKTELSWSYSTGYSFYTGYLVEGAQASSSDANGDGALTLKEIHDYAVPRVVADTQADEVQTPQSYNPVLLDGVIVRGDPDVVRMGAASVEASEGDGAATVWLVREGDGARAISVTVSTASETAVPGKDYTELAGSTVSWAAGDFAPKSVSVSLADDTQKEGAESFWVLCGSPKAAVVSPTQNMTRVTLRDNDSARAGSVRFAASAAGVAESALYASVSVVRELGSDGVAHVRYRTRPSTALAGADYLPAEGVLSWGAGDASSRTIRIPVVADALWEESERFELELFDASGAALGAPAVASVTLANAGSAKSPGKARLAPAALSVSEADGVARVTVAREGGSDGAVEVRVVPVGLTAKAGVNFAATNAVVRWEHGDAAPKAYDVALLDDGAHRPDLTFRLQLTDFKGGLSASPGGTASLVTLRDAKASVTLAEAIDSPSWPCASGGSGLWYGQTLESADGADAAQLGGAALAKGRDATLLTSVAGPGVLAFAWRLQAQPEDALQFYAGSLVRTQRVGLAGWERVAGVALPAGTQTLKWRFVKNSAVTNAADAAWVDSVAWIPDAAKAGGPQPAAGGTLVSAPQQLAWLAASNAVSYAVYLGASASVQTQLLAQTPATSLPLPPLTLGATYYWRVDAVSAAGRVTRGAAWAFKVPRGELARVEKPGDQAATVGLPFSLALALRDGSPAALAYSVRGLPAGLSATAAGLISGRPAKAGTNVVTVSAVNSFGAGPAESFSLAVAELPAETVGAFSGLAGLGADAEGADHRLCGAAQLAVTAAGAVSGSLRLMEGTYGFSGIFSNGVGGAVFDKTLLLKSGAARLRLWPNADATLGQRGYRGELSGAAGACGLALMRGAAAGDRLALVDYAGAYTVALPLGRGETNAAAPQGAGFLTAKVDVSGGVTLAGALADGTAWSGSATAAWAPDGDGLVVPVFAVLYRGLGMLWGALRLAPQGAGFYDNTAEPYLGTFFSDAEPTGREGLVWYAAGQPSSRSYPEGFDLDLAASGGAYNVGVTSLEALIGRPDFKLWLRVDPVADSACDPSVVIGLAGGAAWLPAKGALNPCGTAFAVSAQTGLFSGSFTLSDTSGGKAVARRVAYRGALAPLKWMLGDEGYESPGAGFFTVSGLLPSTATSRIVSPGVQLLWAPVE